MLLREADQLFRNELHDLSTSVMRSNAMQSAPFGVFQWYPDCAYYVC